MSAYHQDYGFDSDEWDSGISGGGFSDDDWGAPPPRRKTSKRGQRSSGFDWSDDFGAFDSSASRSGYSPKKNSTDSFDSFDDYGFGYGLSGYGGYSRRSSSASWRKVAAAASAVLLVVLCVFGIAGTIKRKADTQLSSPTVPALTLPQATVPAPTIPPSIPQPTQPVQPTQPPAVSSPSGNRYCRGILSTEEQTAYDVLLDCVAARAETSEYFYLSDLDDISRVFEAVRNDWPEYFWLQNYFSYEYYLEASGYKITFKPTYWCTAAEIPAQQKVIDEALEPILSQLQGKSEYEKAVGVYSYLADYYTYNLHYKGTSLYDAVRDHQAVCHGYAETTAYLLRKLGLEVIIATGEADNGATRENHAWNIVRVDGKYYQLDSTWGDMDNHNGNPDVRYDYCLLPTSILRNTHFFDEDMYPQCISMDSNYFVQNGLYMTSYDEQFLTDVFSKAVSTGASVSFMCSDPAVYQDTLSRLFDGGRLNAILTKLCPGQAFSYSYWENEDTYTFALRTK